MSRHFVTDIDLEIIKNLYNLRNNQTITTYSLAKSILKNATSRRYTNNYTKYLDYRMKILSLLGVIDISNLDGRKIYTLILNNVYFKRIKYKKIGINEEAVFIRDGKGWDIYFYNEL